MWISSKSVSLSNTLRNKVRKYEKNFVPMKRQQNVQKTVKILLSSYKNKPMFFGSWKVL